MDETPKLFPLFKWIFMAISGAPLPLVVSGNTLGIRDSHLSLPLDGATSFNGILKGKILIFYTRGNYDTEVEISLSEEDCKRGIDTLIRQTRLIASIFYVYSLEIAQDLSSIHFTFINKKHLPPFRKYVWPLFPACPIEDHQDNSCVLKMNLPVRSRLPAQINEIFQGIMRRFGLDCLNWALRKLKHPDFPPTAQPPLFLENEAWYAKYTRRFTFDGNQIRQMTFQLKDWPRRADKRDVHQWFNDPASVPAFHTLAPPAETVINIPDPQHQGNA